MAQNTQEDEDMHVFDQSDTELPPLPSDDDESFVGVHPPSDGPANSEGSAFIEREMKRKLMDIESSFLPDPTETGNAPEASAGADDTYIYGHSGRNFGHQPNTSKESPGNAGNDEFHGEIPRAEDVALPDSPPTPDGAYKTPAPNPATHGEQHSDEEYQEGDTSFEEPAPSSPSAAAARRTNARASSADSKRSRPTEPAIEVTDEDASKDHQEHEAQSPQRPRSSSTRPTSSASTVKAGLGVPDTSHGRVERTSGLSPTMSSASSDSRSASSRTSNLVRKRPSFMRSGNGNGSQRSSTSSFAARSEYSSDGENNHLGADYALQSGGAVSSSSQRHNRADLSRLPSLGSVVSSISGQSEGRPHFERSGSSTISALSGFAGHHNLERLDEEPRPRTSSPPTTPRPFSSGTQGPVDTVIANHVRNIRVPDTVAKEYREKHGERSPDRKSASTSAFAYSSRTKHNLTLKEQNSKIDKLSKENFDLKLKIHFLDQALQNRSDEGVKEMISKNVQLQTDLATEKKDNQSLRRKVRDLERKLKAQEEGLAAAKATSSESEDAKSNRSSGQAEMEEEIAYLRECLQHSEVENEKLREESLAKEVEKRRMAEYVKSMGERRNSEPTAAVEEAMEMWKDLLEAETARREQADEDAQRLREEIRRLKSETSSQGGNNSARNYNTSRPTRMSYARSQSGSDGTNEYRPGTTTTDSSATLVEQLKHENAELRRDLGAQTSMLVSRNRERERLQQEIEELKLSQRRGDRGEGGRSIAGDSIFERSISRANNRPSSRMSAAHRSVAELTDAERDEYEAKEAQLRDEVASTKMVNQDLERELNAQLDLLERTEEENRALREERDLNVEDLQALQQERDEALNALQEKDNECDDLREEAIQTIERLEQEIEQKEQELDRIINELENRNEDFEAMQQEMKNVSESLVALEDDRNASHRKIQQFEQELEDANQELDSLDQALNEARQKIERFEVQSESNQNEISFLREEQETDKIKIGDLEAALNQAQLSIQDEKERLKELDERFTEDRRQREALDSQEKEQVQKAFDELNGQASKAKEEVRRLRKGLSSKEVEASTWKERLDDLESSLRDALGSLDGSKPTLLKDVTKLQRDLDATVQELDHSRAELAEKDRMLRNRDALLESTGLESRKLSDMLDKERQARLQDKHRFEQAQRSHQTTSRTVQSYETRMLELETSRSQDRRRIAQLEAQYRDQLLERHNLLLALWNRLSTLCGTEWAQRNSLVNGELPSLEIIGRNLPGFSKNILNAIKTVEGVIGSFKSRIRSIEKDLWKDYQTLEHTLDVRVKRLDAIEKHVRNGVGVGIPRNESAEVSRLKSENKMLKSELQLGRQNTNTSSRNSTDAVQLSTPHRSNPSGDSQSVRSTSKRNSVAATLLRHHSSSAVDMLDRHSSQHNNPSQSQPPPQQQPSEQRWIHRLKELERRLKSEREARLLDRSGARKRLEEGRAENEELKQMLERERERQGSEFGGSPEPAEYPTVSTR